MFIYIKWYNVRNIKHKKKGMVGKILWAHILREINNKTLTKLNVCYLINLSKYNSFSDTPHILCFKLIILFLLYTKVKKSFKYLSPWRETAANSTALWWYGRFYQHLCYVRYMKVAILYILYTITHNSVCACTHHTQI